MKIFGYADELGEPGDIPAMLPLVDGALARLEQPAKLFAGKPIILPDQPQALADISRFIF